MNPHDTMVHALDRHTLRCIERDASSIGGEWGTKRAQAARRELRRGEEQDKEATTEHDHD